MLARAGVASRRACEPLIASGHVRVNGKVVTELGTRVEPDADQIEVDGKRINPVLSCITFMLHKPTGVVSTAKDTHGRPTVVDLVPSPHRLFPVGRLDADSEGLLLLTNDGPLAYALTHPKNHVPKVYKVWVAGVPSQATLHRLSQGVELEDGLTAPARVSVIGTDKPERARLTPATTILQVTLYEGRKRQLRRMCETVDHPVVRLLRTQVGPIRLGELQPGSYRPLTPAEVSALWKAAGANP